MFKILVRIFRFLEDIKNKQELFFHKNQICKGVDGQ